MTPSQLEILAITRLVALDSLEFTSASADGPISATYQMPDVAGLLLKHGSQTAETALFNYEAGACTDPPSLAAFSISGRDLLPVHAPSFWFLHPKLSLSAYLSELYMRVVPATRFREPSTLVVIDAVARALASQGADAPSFHLEVNPSKRDLRLKIRTSERERFSHAFISSQTVPFKADSLLGSLATSPKGPLFGADEWSASAFSSSRYFLLMREDSAADITAHLDSSAVEVATPFYSWASRAPFTKFKDETINSWTTRHAEHMGRMAVLRTACSAHPHDKAQGAAPTSASLSAASAALRGPVLIELQSLARCAVNFVVNHEKLSAELAAASLLTAKEAAEKDSARDAPFQPSDALLAEINSTSGLHAREMMLQRHPSLPSWLDVASLTYKGFPPVELFFYLGSIIGYWCQKPEGKREVASLLKKYVDDELAVLTSGAARHQISSNITMQVDMLGVATTTLSPRAMLQELMLRAYSMRKTGRFTPMPSIYQTTSQAPSIEQSARATHLALMCTHSDPPSPAVSSDSRPARDRVLRETGLTPSTVSLNASVNWVVPLSRVSLAELISPDSDLQLITELMAWASLVRVGSEVNFRHDKQLLHRYIAFWNRPPAAVDVDLVASSSVGTLFNDGQFDPSSSTQFRAFFSRVYRSNEHRNLRLSYDIWNETADFYTATRQSQYLIVKDLTSYDQDLSSGPELTELLLKVTLAKLTPPSEPHPFHVGEYTETQPTPAGIASMKPQLPKFFNYIL